MIVVRCRTNATATNSVGQIVGSGYLHGEARAFLLGPRVFS